MKNQNYSFCLACFIWMLFSSQMLLGQWETVPIPGGENISNLINIGGDWVAQGETGCYHSADDGLSWTKTLDFASSYASATAQFGSDIYVVSYNQGLLRSSNQGVSWDLLSSQMPGNLIYPDGLGITDHYILFETNKAVYRYPKLNPGAPTALLDFGQLYYPNTLLMQVDGNNVWVAVKDSLFRSTNEGNSWNLVYEGHRASGLAVHGDTIMLCTSNGVQRSVNNGVTWNKVYNGSQNYGIFWRAGKWFFRDYSGNNTEFQYSTNGGNSWAPYEPLLDASSVSILTFAENNGTILLGTSIGIARSTDNGNYWEVRNTGISNDNSFFTGEGRLSVTGNYLDLYGSSSEDDGQTWFRPLVDANNLGYPYVAHNGDYFAVDYDQKLYRSAGDLRHWQSTGVQFTAGVSHKLLSEGDNFYMFEYDTWNGIPATIYKSIDNGVNWSPTGGITYTALGVVAIGDFLFEWRGTLGLFRSQNGGITWQSVGAGLSEFAQGGGGVGLHAAGSHLFAYSNNAIMVSSNNGLTFTKISNNLLGNSGFPTGADYLVSDGDITVVFTYDGIFLSQGLNDQWFNIRANLPSEDFYSSASLAIHHGSVYMDYGGGANYPLWKRSIASFHLAQFDGKVWRDDNNNGQQDSGEQPYPGAILQAGSGSFATTGPDGNYKLFADLNNDTLRIKKPAPWVQANPLFYQVNTSESGKNFGLYFPPNITDLKVDLTNATVFRPGFEENIYLSYTNVGTAEADGVIRFVPKAPLEFQSAFPAPDGISGDTLWWNFQNFALSSNEHIVISVKVPANVPLGSKAMAFAEIIPANTDANFEDNQTLLSEIVFGSYDPNDKRCSPEKLTPEQVQESTPLVYTIRFQNTGTYPAEFVRIADTLDFERLDVSSFEVLATSHPCQTSLRGAGAIEFLFNPIDLPPSEFNEPASHGFVKYSIRPKNNLALGQQIRNTAYIYFDYNPAIVTNTTLTEVVQTVDTKEVWSSASNQPLTISPNPSTGIIQILTGDKNPGRLLVFNAFGQYLVEWQGEYGAKKLGKVLKIK